MKALDAPGGGGSPLTRRLQQALRGLLLVGCVAAALSPGVTHAEYGDVIINQNSDRSGMRPVVFPHWFHRVRFRCKVCHHELGFKMRAGSNTVMMADIIDGKFCGMCHNGQIAWAADRCDYCHSGKKGLPSRVMGGAETLGPGRW